MHLNKILVFLFSIILFSSFVFADSTIWNAESQTGVTCGDNAGGAEDVVRRTLVKSEYITGDASRISIYFKMHSSTATSLYNVSICEKSVSDWDCIDETWKMIYFDGSLTSPGTSGNLYTDNLTYSIDSTKDYLITYVLEDDTRCQYTPAGGTNERYSVTLTDSTEKDWAELGDGTDKQLMSLTQILETNINPLNATLNINPEIMNPNYDLNISYNSTSSANITLNCTKNEVNFYNLFFNDSQKNSTIIQNTSFDLFDNISCSLSMVNGTWNLTIVTNKTIGQTINFTANNTFTGAAINNFTITYSEGSFNATGNNITIYNWNESDTYYFSHPDYINSNITLTTNVSSQTYNFELFTTNSVNFIFRNAINNSLISNVNKTVYLYSSSLSINYNFSSINSSYYIDVLNPLTYTVTVDAAGFSGVSFILTVTNKTTQSKTVYLYPNTTTTTITYNVFDDLGNQLKNAKIQALSYINSSWTVIGECLTDSIGECSINLQANKWYHYYVFYTSSVTPDFATSSPEYLDYTTRSPFILSLAQSQISEYVEFDKVNIVSFTATNSTEYNYTFRLQGTYGGNINNLCIRLNGNFANGTTLLKETCTVSSGDIIYLNRILGNHTYTATVYSVIDDVYFPLESITVSLRGNEARSIFGVQGVFIAFLIVLFLATLGLVTADLLGLVAGAELGIIISSLISLISLNITTIIVMIVIGLILVVRPREPGN